MCESSDREAIELGGPWRQGGSEAAMLCCSSLAILPELMLNTMVFNLGHYLTIRN